LSGGQYVVKVDSSTLPSGLTVTLDNNLTKIILPTGDHREDLDFGYQGLGKIGDTVWIDSNGTVHNNPQKLALQIKGLNSPSQAKTVCLEHQMI
jgi:hypothetical protein